MNQYHFRLPDIGEGVAEAEIIAWHVAVGDHVKTDQNLVDVMTDKATVDISSPIDGVIVSINGEVGSLAKVGGVLVEFETDAPSNVADAPVPVREAAKPISDVSAPKPTPAPAPLEPPKPVRSSARPEAGINRSPFAAPATRHRAHELGIPLQFVPGTGPGGRILPQDLDAYITHGPTAPAGNAGYQARHNVAEVKIVGLRRKIAEKMQEAKRRIPHITYVEEIDVTALEALRQSLNEVRKEGQPKLTLLPFLIRALVRVLEEFPQFNARYDDDAGVLHEFEPVHVGIATQTPTGLMVPVVRHAEARPIWDCATELVRVSNAAKAGSASREELSGSTITITSLGPLAGIATTPIINHPEVAIIGPNKIFEKTVVQGNFVSVRKVMNMSSSFDHRIIDGYDAACFVQALKRLLEHPALIFMESFA